MYNVEIKRKIMTLSTRKPQTQVHTIKSCNKWFNLSGKEPLPRGFAAALVKLPISVRAHNDSVTQ